jgi:hypothetical protein
MQIVVRLIGGVHAGHSSATADIIEGLATQFQDTIPVN